MALLKVATTQFNTGNDVQQNLDKFLCLIDQAAAGGARLVVGPEFGNHTSFYRDREHAWDVAVEVDSDYVHAIRQRAREKGIYVVFNATCRDGAAIHIRNFLVADTGELIGTDDKQVLMGGESIHLSPSTHPGRVFETGIGRIAMMSCLDGVPPETARNLALQGAQLITNSHNSCALDEPYLHIPVRAAENRVWIMAAGKVGYICAEDMVGPLIADVGIPRHLLIALGENPILNPHGVEVAKLPSGAEGIVFADVDLGDALDKRWRDGDLFADRRPALYGAVGAPPETEAAEPAPPFQGAVINVRCDREFEENCHRALDLVADAADNGGQLMVLPELCTLIPDQIAQDVALAEERSRIFEDALAVHCRELAIYVATSMVTRAGDEYFHTGIVLDDRGQRSCTAHQTHLPHSYRAWCSPGDELQVFDTPLGRLAIMVGYDAVFPEVASVLARRGAEVILHPTAWKFDWEVRLALPERAAENRVSVLSAARSDTQVSRGGLISALSESKPLRARDLNPIWPLEAPFDRETHVSARIVPARSRNKDLLGFDLQEGRRPELYGAILQA